MSSAEQPNILVIWGDDIGITNLSCYSDGLMDSENFGSFVKERNSPVEIDCDDSVVEIRQDLFPGYARRRLSVHSTQGFHFHDRNSR